MDREQFEQLVEEALAALPQKFKKYIENLAVIVEDYPSGETQRKVGTSRGGSLLGLYHGVPFKHRGPYYGNLPPDVIVIYQKPIESISATDEELKEKVQEVVLHEVGHYFGMSDAELHAIEREIRQRRR
jgi:predicted Zn-dependent protease with MMP-like domain